MPFVTPIVQKSSQGHEVFTRGRRLDNMGSKHSLDDGNFIHSH